jgi:hypothetical protein
MHVFNHICTAGENYEGNTPATSTLLTASVLSQNHCHISLPPRVLQKIIWARRVAGLRLKNITFTQSSNHETNHGGNDPHNYT